MTSAVVWEYIVHGDAEAAIIDILKNFTPELASFNPTVSGNMVGYAVDQPWIEVTLEGSSEDWPAVDKPRIDIMVLGKHRTIARDMAAIVVASIKRAMGAYRGKGLFLSDAKIEQGMTRVPDKYQENDRYVISFRLTTRPSGSWEDAGSMVLPAPPAPFAVGDRVRYSGDSMTYIVIDVDETLGKTVIQIDDNTGTPPLIVDSSTLTFLPGYGNDFPPGTHVQYQLDARVWVIIWAAGQYAAVYDFNNPSSYNIFYQADLWVPTDLTPLFSDVEPPADYTFADTTGGPVYSYSKLVFRYPDAGAGDVFVDAVQAWVANTDNYTGYIKWYKPAAGTTSQRIYYPGPGRGEQGYDLPTSDVPPQGTLDSLNPTSAAQGQAGVTVTVTGTGSGFTADNVTEVYVSDTPDSGGFALAATYVDANTITFEFPIADFPNPDDQNYSSTMYVRLPAPGGPANTGIEFDLT